MKHRNFGSSSGRSQRCDSRGLDNTPCQITLTSKHLPEWNLVVVVVFKEKSRASSEAEGWVKNAKHLKTTIPQSQNLVDFVHRKEPQCSTQNVQRGQKYNSKLIKQPRWLSSQNLPAVDEPIWVMNLKRVYRTELRFPTSFGSKSSWQRSWHILLLFFFLMLFRTLLLWRLLCYTPCPQIILTGQITDLDWMVKR